LAKTLSTATGRVISKATVDVCNRKDYVACD